MREESRPTTTWRFPLPPKSGPQLQPDPAGEGYQHLGRFAKAEIAAGRVVLFVALGVVEVAKQHAHRVKYRGRAPKHFRVHFIYGSDMCALCAVFCALPIQHGYGVLKGRLQCQRCGRELARRNLRDCH